MWYHYNCICLCSHQTLRAQQTSSSTLQIFRITYYENHPLTVRGNILNICQCVKAEWKFTNGNHQATQNQKNISFFGWITSWYWSIHEHSTHLLRSNSHLSWDGRVDGGGVNQQCPLLHLPKESDTKKTLKQFCLAKIYSFNTLKSQASSTLSDFQTGNQVSAFGCRNWKYGCQF